MRDLQACWNAAYTEGSLIAYPVRLPNERQFTVSRIWKKYPIEELRPGESFDVLVVDEKRVNSIRCSLLTCIRSRRQRRHLEDREFTTIYVPQEKIIKVLRTK